MLLQKSYVHKYLKVNGLITFEGLGHPSSHDLYCRKALVPHHPPCCQLLLHCREISTAPLSALRQALLKGKVNIELVKNLISKQWSQNTFGAAYSVWNMHKDDWTIENRVRSSTYAFSMLKVTTLKK